MDLPKATRDLITRGMNCPFEGEESRKASYIITQLTEREREDADVRILTDTLSQLIRARTREAQNG